MEIYDNHSLKGLNTFGIDARARRLLFLRGSTLDEPSRFMNDVEELLESDFLKAPYMIIGEGSNIVFTKDYEGSLIKVGEAVFHGDDDGRYKYLTVGASMLTDEVVRFSVDYGYYGMENLSAVPGNIGAAVVQNVGAYGVEIKDLVETVEAIDLLNGDRHAFTCEECLFGYRTSLFKQQPGRWLIWRVKLRFSSDFRPNLSYKALADERLLCLIPAGSSTPALYFFACAGKAYVELSPEEGRSRVSGTKVNNEWQALNDTVAKYDQHLRALFAKDSISPQKTYARTEQVYTALSRRISEAAIKNKDNALGRFISSHYLPK